MSLFMKQKQTYRHRKQISGYQKGKGGRDKLGIWDQQIQTTVCKADKQSLTVQCRGLYSISYNNIMEKNTEQNIHLQHFAVHLKLTQHCKLTLLQ